ncbi:hypothetical protein BDN71DRAFT_1442476 [Pleurotus eryngii]|uniref:Uncharacterized protein n=1 Tax=Pleurotus eryngii TaxID=5323 RepID=A0A9P6A6A2_PLEER|nr:hypothetical protein BDN71DRAFT_1442476 [Pleurotus eryngii]
MADPAAKFAEAVSAFTKSVNLTFAEVQKHARAEALRPIQLVKDERDEQVRIASTSQAELVSCKGLLQQAELTIARQAETIAQLRREVAQWKDQAQNWQEHFLRVEEQRCALSTRLDEWLVGQQSMIASMSQRPPLEDPSSSRSQDIDALPTPRSIKTKTPNPQRREPSSPHYPAEASASTSTRALKASKTPHKPIPQPSAAGPSSPSATVIRRVHAVINIPIKDEPASDEETPAITHPATTSSSHRPKRRIVRDDDSDNVSEPERSRADDNTTTGRDEEDDELMLGAVKTPAPRRTATRRATNAPSQHESAPQQPTTATSRKRKPAEASRSAKKVRKVPAN